MKVNPGFFISKFLRWLNRPALRDCKIAKSAKIGTGSNCISMTIGRYSYIGKNNSIANTQIGAFCSIASYCAIGGGAHALDMVSTSPVFVKGRNIFGKNFSSFEPHINKPVIIGNDVWIGEKVFINDGITIGDGAIIGAHSVVTHDVPSYAIVAGAPAKVIRYRYDSEDIEFLKKFKWWDKSDSDLSTIANKFNSVEDLKNLE